MPTLPYYSNAILSVTEGGREGDWMRGGGGGVQSAVERENGVCGFLLLPWSVRLSVTHGRLRK